MKRNLRHGITALGAFMCTSLLCAQTNSSPWPSYGNVGIGTTNPEQLLHLKGGNAWAVLERGSPANLAIISFANTGNAAQWAIGLDSTANNSFGLFNYASSANALTVTPAGDVGIGTTSPGAKLDVLGNVRQLGTNVMFQAWGSGQIGLQLLNQGDLHDQRFTELVAQNGCFSARFVNDAYSLAENWLLVSRNQGTYSTKAVVFPSGNVGLGAADPITSLHVVKKDSTDNLGAAFFDHYSGVQNITPNITLRTARGTMTSPAQTLSGDAIAGFSGAGFTAAGTFGVRCAAIRYWAAEEFLSTAQGSYITLETTSKGSTVRQVRMVIADSGNIGIGTSNPTQKLSVDGTVRAKEVVVESTGWSDYVFQDGYVLQPLAEVEAHIKAHRQLPGIPSAADVAKRGVPIGEMQAKLLAKIEELTLHQIALEKTVEALVKERSEFMAHLSSKTQARSAVIDPASLNEAQ